MQAAKRRGKFLGRSMALSIEQINHAEQMIDTDQETVTSMALLLGVHRNTLQRAISK